MCMVQSGPLLWLQLALSLSVTQSSEEAETVVQIPRKQVKALIILVTWLQKFAKEVMWANDKHVRL